MTTSTAKTSKSFSVQQRERGNDFYNSATDVAIGRTIRLTRLEKALECYMNALSCKTTEDEEVSAMKNISMISRKLAGTYLEKVPNRKAKVRLDNLVNKNRQSSNGLKITMTRQRNYGGVTAHPVDREHLG